MPSHCLVTIPSSIFAHKQPMLASPNPNRSQHISEALLQPNLLSATLEANSSDSRSSNRPKNAICKLELQFELAKLALVSSQPSKPSFSDENSSKSMGDLKAPQKTRFPQPWPHIFTPGEPQLYSELSLPAFCAGYIAILEQYTDSLEIPSEALLSHFHDLLVLACNYKWSAVHAYHYKVLRSIELGLVKWGDSFQSFKQPFFIPSALLPENSPKESKQPPRPSSSSSPIARTDICNAWSWYDDCMNASCPKFHVCVVCKRPDHRALACPKRRFPVPTRRQESAPRD